ncbi:MAG: nicotinamide-nucleotide amidohydrolase family protein [bacterium]
MTIELIIIGDEILNGRTIDANLAWLAPWLFKQGLKLGNVSIVRDDQAQMLTALEFAWSRSNVVLTSGGIGPTLDDLTKTVLAEFADKKLQDNKLARSIVENNYARLQRPWSPSTNGYHLIPEDFLATDNPGGLAPGLVWFNDKKALMAAPGVPKEFALMIEHVFFPLLKENGFNVAGDQAQVIMRTYGVPEEKIFGELCPNLWQQLEAFGKVSSLPHLTGVDILVTFNGANNKNKFQSEIQTIVESSPLSGHVWQWGELSLEQLIVDRATQKGLTFCFAESCTGGLAASKITDIAGSSNVFLGSAVTYANHAKSELIGVSQTSLKSFGAVSEQVAQEMAQGALEKFGADLCISFSGIAGPGGGTELKPVGLVCQGFASKDKKQSRSLQFRGDRLKLKERFALSGLFWLLEQLS